MGEKTSAVATVPARSVIADMATRFGMERAAFESTLRKTIMPADKEVSNEQLVAFLVVAKEYELSPFTKEIFAFPRPGGGIQPVVSIDGWLKIINSHPQFDGMEFADNMEDGKIVSVTCRMYRKDRTKPVEVTEYMAECRRDTDTWKKWPARMLRHKATIQAARYAFGFSGIVDPDEAERAIDLGAAEVVETTTVVQKPRAKSSTREPASIPQEERLQVDDNPLSEELVKLVMAKLEAAALTDQELFKKFGVESFEQIRVSQLESIFLWIKDPTQQ